MQLVLLGVVYYLGKVLNFFEKHPDLALLEGAELLQQRNNNVKDKLIKKEINETIH